MAESDESGSLHKRARTDGGEREVTAGSGSPRNAADRSHLQVREDRHGGVSGIASDPTVCALPSSEMNDQFIILAHVRERCTRTRATDTISKSSPHAHSLITANSNVMSFRAVDNDRHETAIPYVRHTPFCARYINIMNFTFPATLNI